MDQARSELLGWLILLLPLVGAIIAGGLGPRLLRGQSHWPVIGGVGGAAVAAMLLLVDSIRAGAEGFAGPISYAWIAVGGRDWISMQFWIDPLTAIMLAMVTFVATMIVIYSKEYMRHGDHPERGYERFMAFLGLFVFSMCMLVLGGNFVLLYMGWELVGLCSYLLIGFYYQKPSAAAAAKKAFLVNRIGDFGFGLGIFLIYITFGHLDYETVFAAARAAVDQDVAGLATVLGIAPGAAADLLPVAAARLPYIALLLLCGAVGKSAQFPLYVWLPDAMEGPSPVSALIHAATMVTAGVYMMVRCGVIFTASDGVMTLIAIIGAGTALFAATMALVQTDMKRILAYSTISQLGYMFLGVGVFAASSAIFHLFTHAFFKALLFLGAGSVMHAMGGIIDVRRFGGLRRVLPWTFMTMLIGSAALAGFPLLAGFWSKDEIVHAAFERHMVFGLLGLLTAALTAFYTFRMMFLAFWGQERIPEGVHAHESGPWIRFPLVVLALGAAFAGYVGVHVQAGGFLGFLEPSGGIQTMLADVTAPFDAHHATHAIGDHAAAVHGDTFSADTTHEALAATTEHEAHGVWAALVHHWLMYVSALIALLGIYVAYLFYVKRPWVPQLLSASMPEAHRVLWNKYYVDEAYDRTVVQPLWKSGVLAFRIDDFFIDGILWLVTVICRLIGQVGRIFQGGALQGYGLSMAAGLAIIVVLALWGSGSMTP